MSRIILGAAAALALGACGGSSSGNNYETGPSSAPIVALDQSAALQEFRAKGNSSALYQETAGGTAGGTPSPQQFIAYTHSLGLNLPKAAVEPMYNAHIEACRAAGPAKCLVTNSNLRKQAEDRVYGDLYVRATEEWITEFNASLDADVSAAKGEITARNSTATDLTTQIVDTDARLQAQVTLRSRLVELLENRDGELGDFLQIERELARVTGTINSIEANLKALKYRVSMSTFTISYQPIISSLAPSQFEPLGEAFGEFFYNLSMAFGAVITAFAVGLPWMILIGIMVFIWLRLIWPWVRKRKEKKT